MKSASFSKWVKRVSPCSGYEVYRKMNHIYEDSQLTKSFQKNNKKEKYLDANKLSRMVVYQAKYETKRNRSAYFSHRVDKKYDVFKVYAKDGQS